MANDNLKKLITNKREGHIWKIKEVLQLQFIWYLTLGLLSLANKYNLPNTPELNSFMHYLFGIIIKLLLIAYLIYILLFQHNFSLNRIGLTSNNYLNDLKFGIKISLPFPILTIILINLQHQVLDLNQLFQPLIKITSFNQLITSFLYFILLLFLTLIPALAIELFYRVIIYDFFKERFGRLLGALSSSLYYSIVLLRFEFGFLLGHFLIGLISIYLYEKNNNIFPSIIWQSFYQATTILYVFGFHSF
ncbi:CPBP family intramembrane glutamic endopeptidase [Selenihalanaerobacter shriftii]|uniref:CAAX prenyl protease 2/Lysostaphin resistance protein A-like domain-containing protein n=1 Tax=Selenihalanaerobacter shriftii TaxID=142842 RepID=A0A1T4Q673_9FIRM|nr:CPBP family intramembrane glutamic endopeptidase [Selenihalanaerobacter shriftii]SJZ99196.1 hypothetical protein SAMN02745118_02451 [Selenihalanaerobacter shriftii]